MSKGEEWASMVSMCAGVGLLPAGGSVWLLGGGVPTFLIAWVVWTALILGGVLAAMEEDIQREQYRQHVRREARRRRRR